MKQMVQVRDFIFVQNNNNLFGYGYVQSNLDYDVKSIIKELVSPPYLMLLVKASEDGMNVENAEIEFHMGEDVKHLNMDQEVKDIQLFLSSEIFSNDISQLQDNLPTKIQHYMDMYHSEYSNDTLQTLICPVLSDKEGRIGKPDETDVSQLALDSFLIHTISYLACLQLLMDDNIQQQLPFSFSMPYQTLNENVLNTNLFQYLNPICTAEMSSTQNNDEYSSIYIIFDRIIRFCNEWGSIFEPGTPLDFQQSLMDTCSGYSSIVIQQASIMQNQIEETQHNLENRIQEFQEVLQTEIKQYIEKWNNNIQNSLEETLEKNMEYIKHSLNKEKETLLNEIKIEIKDHVQDIRKSKQEIKDYVQDIVSKEIKASQTSKEQKQEIKDYVQKIIYEELQKLREQKKQKKIKLAKLENNPQKDKQRIKLRNNSRTSPKDKQRIKLRNNSRTSPKDKQRIKLRNNSRTSPKDKQRIKLRNNSSRYKRRRRRRRRRS